MATHRTLFRRWLPLGCLLWLLAACGPGACGPIRETDPTPTPAQRESPTPGPSPTPSPTRTPGPAPTSVPYTPIEGLARLSLEGPQTGGTALSIVTWRARLTDDHGTPLANRKLILSLNHEGNRELVQMTDNDGRVSFDLALVDTELSACCVDGDAQPTRYTIRVRFDGDRDFRPVAVDAYQGYRNGGAEGTIQIEQEDLVLPAGMPLALSVTYTPPPGMSAQNVLLFWDSLDLGQHKSCVTGPEGRCAIALVTDGRPAGSYGVSVTVKGYQPSGETLAPVTDALAVQITGSDTPPWREMMGGWYWWQYNGSPNPKPSEYQALGLYQHYDLTEIVTGWNGAAELHQGKLNELVADAASRRYTLSDGRQASQPIIFSFGLNTESGRASSAFGPYTTLGCGINTPPIWDAAFMQKLLAVPAAFRAWYDANPQAQATVVGFTFGAGFHNEWLQPFRNAACREEANARFGWETAYRNYELSSNRAWSQAFSGTGVAIHSQGPAVEGAGLWPPINAKVSIINRPTGNAFKSNAPHIWGWTSLGRRQQTRFICEDADSDFFAGSYGEPDQPSHWSVAWAMTAQAAHFRCAELHADGIGGGYFDAFEYEGQPSIPGFDTLGKAVLNPQACHERVLLAWWAHEAARNWRKDDPTSGGHQHVQGYNADVYGDWEACLVRREVEPTTPLSPHELPAPASRDYFVNPRGQGDAFSARRGETFFFDVHDGFAATHPGTLWLRIVALNNGGAITIEWPTTSGTTSTTLEQASDGSWGDDAIQLAGFENQNAVFERGTDLRVSGNELILTHLSVSTIPPPGAPP
jgi:hypothetical protein